MAELSILDIFEPKVRKNIFDFCKDINNTKADIYIVMARKAACLVSVLEKMKLLTLNGEVISERVLDCNIDWNKYKNVIIIDDVVISGTTLYQTIRRINSANPSIRIDLFVLGVNKDWYKEDVLENDKGISFIHDPIRYYDNTECIRLSGDIVRMLAQYPVPYNIDFPIYNTLRLNSFDYEQVMTLPGWKVSEVISFTHENNDVFTHTFIPQTETLENFGPFYLSEALRHSLLKIRTYCRCRNDKKRELYLLTIVPMLILPPIETEEINKLFFELAGPASEELSVVLDSSTSRLRFVQFVLADLMARRFVLAINSLLGDHNRINREFGSLRYLFPSFVIGRISEMADKFEGNLNLSLRYTEMKVNGKGAVVNELLDINDALNTPFKEMYYQEELSSRRLVREYGKRVFTESSYARAINRLKRGISLTELVNSIKGIDERMSFSFVSAFLDRAIDQGIVVPITVEKNGLVYRAFRHGEDVQFGQQEERLCYDMLNVFSKQIGRNDIPKLWMEKMLVLLFQLGEGNLFMPIQTCLESYDDISGTPKTDVASVKYYLQGPLVVRTPKDKPFTKQYLEHIDKAEWMTSLMTKASYSPVKLAQSGMFTFDYSLYRKLSEGDDQIVIDSKKTMFANNVGLLFGLLLANESKKTKPFITSSEMVMLTSSLETKNIIGALAAEMNICYDQFTRQEDDGIYNILKGIIDKSIDPEVGFRQIRKSTWYQAINDGIRKYTWYRDHRGNATINRITAQFDDYLYKSTWESLWSLNMEQRGNVEKEEVVKIAVTEGLWLICVELYYLMLFYLIDNRIAKNAKRRDALVKVKELYNLLTRHSQYSAVRVIVPIVASFVEKCSDLQYASATIPILFDRLASLFNRCPNLLKTASDYYTNSLRLPRVKFFNHVLYIETFSQEETNSVHHIYEGTRLEMNKVKDRSDVELLKLQRTDGALNLAENQFLFTSFGENGLFWLLQVGIKANAVFRGRGGLRMILFTNLHPDCRIKVTSDAHYECQSFDLVLLQSEELIRLLPFGTDAIYVLSEDEKDIRKFNPDYKDYLQVYMEEHTFYLTSKTNLKLFKYQKMESNLVFKADIGIITIVDEESKAVRDGFEMNLDQSMFINDRYYDFGVFQANEKNFKIVHLKCSKQGNTSMAIAALELAKHFNPDRMILLGIAGGIQDDVRIGDVVIAEDVFYYDSRKEKPDGIVDRRLRSFNPSTRVCSQITRFRSIWPEIKREDCAYSLHVGPIGTGEAVIGDSLSVIKKWLLSVHSKTCAVETEAAGFSEAIQESLNGIIDYLIIRGISDKADVDKDDKYRVLASENAVSVLKHFITSIYSRI